MDAGRETISLIRSHYRSGGSNIGQDFFVPCLTYCSSYRRAAGFFSSSALITWSSVLPKLVDDKVTTVQLLISPQLSESDKQALRQVADAEERDRFARRWADQIVLDALQFAESPTDLALRMKLFAWLIATGRLELRVAFPEHVDAPGPFHEKIGIFSFPWGDTVAFTGSANESIMGHTLNYESVDVYRSWVEADVKRVNIKVSQFQEAWDGNARGLRTLGLSRKILSHIKTIAPRTDPLGDHTGEPDASILARTEDRWRHQDEAVTSFLEAERGILEMATGTGKTRTALRICEHLVREGQADTIVVATDGTDLLDQWYKELLQLSRHLPGRFAILRHYAGSHDIERFLLNSQCRILLASRLALPRALRGLSEPQAQRTILIHDEVHGLGSPSNRRNLAHLSDSIRFRLGLSATPEREYDVEGNAFIGEHIGPATFQFDLADAIRRRILAPFYYYPLEYPTTDEDRERVRSVYAKAAVRKKEGRPMTQEEIWTDLALVYKTSVAKLPVFEEFIGRHPELLTRCIIFVQTKEYGDAVLDIVHQHNYAFHTYFAEDDSDVLVRFANGEIKLLITCHRISQGIDIRSLETVILFSSDRARLETIQRIGRCLRTDPTNPGKMANIIDFIRVSDSQDPDPTADQERCCWLTELASIRPQEDSAC